MSWGFLKDCQSIVTLKIPQMRMTNMLLYCISYNSVEFLALLIILKLKTFCHELVKIKGQRFAFDFASVFCPGFIVLVPQRQTKFGVT